MNASDVLEQIEPIPSAPPLLRIDPRELLARPPTRYTPQIADYWKRLLGVHNLSIQPAVQPPSGRTVTPAEMDVLEFLSSGKYLYALAAERSDDPEVQDRVLLHLARASPGFTDRIPDGRGPEFVLLHLLLDADFFAPRPPARRPVQLGDSRSILVPIPGQSSVSVTVNSEMLDQVARDVRIGRDNPSAKDALDETRQRRVRQILENLTGINDGDDDPIKLVRNVLSRAATIDSEAARLFAEVARADPGLEAALVRQGFRHDRVLAGPVLERIAAALDEAERFAWPPRPDVFPALAAALDHIVALVNAGLQEVRSAQRLSVQTLPSLPEDVAALVLQALDADLGYRAIRLKRDYAASHYRHMNRAPVSLALAIVQALKK